MKYLVDDNILVLGKGTATFGSMLTDFESPLQATVIDRLEASGATLVEDEDISFRLGVDTDGTFRKIASENKEFSFKPSYGTISRYGIVAMVSSMDTINISAKSIDDIQSVYDIIAGSDGKDSTLLINNQQVSKSVSQQIKVSLVKEFAGEFNDETYEKVSFSMAKYILPIYHTLMPAEVYSNMMQYDAIRYGKRSESAKTLEEIYALSRSEGINDETKLNIIMGCYVLSSGVFETYYLQAAKARTMLISEFNKLFKKYDFLIGSVSSDIMSIAVSLAGLPALSLPNGKQIIAPLNKDVELLSFIKTLEGEIK